MAGRLDGGQGMWAAWTSWCVSCWHAPHPTPPALQAAAISAKAAILTSGVATILNAPASWVNISAAASRRRLQATAAGSSTAVTFTVPSSAPTAMLAKVRRRHPRCLACSGRARQLPTRSASLLRPAGPVGVGQHHLALHLQRLQRGSQQPEHRSLPHGSQPHPLPHSLPGRRIALPSPHALRHSLRHL